MPDYRIEESHDLCRHTYDAWVVVSGSNPESLLHAGRLSVTVSPFACLSDGKSVVDISVRVSSPNLSTIAERRAYADVLIKLGGINALWLARQLPGRHMADWSALHDAIIGKPDNAQSDAN